MKFKEMLSRIETGESFSLRWITCSQQRRKGGQVKQLEGLRLMVDATKAKGKKPAKPRSYSYHNSPQHLTLFHEESGRYIRVNKRLITQFNNKEVVY